MRTVELTTDEIAIPVMVKAYLTKDRLIRILGDLHFYGDVTFPIKKSAIIKEVKDHIRLKGYSCYPDCYEDTDDIPIWNQSAEMAEIIINQKFPELQ